jgi:hypothetical protein
MGKIMVAGAVVNQAIFNETALRPHNKLTKVPVEMTQPLLRTIRETGCSWACGTKLSY